MNALDGVYDPLNEDGELGSRGGDMGFIDLVDPLLLCDVSHLGGQKVGQIGEESEQVRAHLVTNNAHKLGDCGQILGHSIGSKQVSNPRATVGSDHGRNSGRGVAASVQVEGEPVIDDDRDISITPPAPDLDPPVGFCWIFHASLWALFPLKWSVAQEQEGSGDISKGKEVTSEIFSSKVECGSGDFF